MSRHVIERDQNGHPSLVVFRDSVEEKAERQAELEIQAQRARDVARSLRAHRTTAASAPSAPARADRGSRELVHG